MMPQIGRTANVVCGSNQLHFPAVIGIGVARAGRDEGVVIVIAGEFAIFKNKKLPGMQFLLTADWGSAARLRS